MFQFILRKLKPFNRHVGLRQHVLASLSRLNKAKHSLHKIYIAILPFVVFMPIFFLGIASASAATPEPRTIIALYDERGDGFRHSFLHQMAEMPLNHLGFRLEYHAIQQPLPDIATREDVRGVISWLLSNSRFPDPERYLAWATAAVDSGKHYVIMGNLGIGDGASVHAVNEFLSRIGIKTTGGWRERTFAVSYKYHTPDMVVSRDIFKWLQPPYETMEGIKGQSTVHLAVESTKSTQEPENHLIITSPQGGYIAEHYIFRTNTREDDDVNQWMINPFAFFRLAFASDDIPKPDTTSIAGRRIYYSHIDGDGWNNITTVEEYKKKPVLSSEVILEKAVAAYPNLPVTLALIAGDIDPKWAAVKDSRRVAQDFMALPQVEAASHTYSHPFYWQFFKDGNWQDEAFFLSRYTHKTWQATDDMLKGEKPYLPEGYATPRAYAYEPFDASKEISGARDAIAELLPAGKKVEFVAWSGNCSPDEHMLRRTREAGLENINGGDTRSDAEYPGYASVAPIGIKAGKEQQIYASSSNENTYTSLWSKNFHAFLAVVDTFKYTETPMRLKPINIYYHIFSGEKQPSLHALINALEYATKQNIAPVTASHYSKIAQGFYTTDFIKLAPETWQVENRNALQTIRFDNASEKTVDFVNSSGVIGGRLFQGSLYVYLDTKVETPVVSIKDNRNGLGIPQEKTPYLVESRWLISNLQRNNQEITFNAQGFGTGEMVWNMPKAGTYRITASGTTQEIATDADKLLRVTIKENAIDPIPITISRI